jgi:hypothetical protein
MPPITTKTLRRPIASESRPPSTLTAMIATVCTSRHPSDGTVPGAKRRSRSDSANTSTSTTQIVAGTMNMSTVEAATDCTRNVPLTCPNGRQIPITPATVPRCAAGT